MWCQAGFGPETFLEQTAATFAASLRGRAKAREQMIEREVSLAWHTAAFSAAAQAGKLKSLKEYRGKAEDRKVQSPQQMLGALRMLQDMGAPMTIKQVN